MMGDDAENMIQTATVIAPGNEEDDAVRVFEDVSHNRWRVPPSLMRGRFGLYSTGSVCNAREERDDRNPFGLLAPHTPR